jgi:uncharacterized membrane protein
MQYAQRMIVATIITIISVVTFIIGYIVLAWPLAYITDALIDGYPSGPVVGSVEEIRNSETNLNYFLAAAFLGGIILTFIWLWVYAHKREYEQD